MLVRGSIPATDQDPRWRNQIGKGGIRSGRKETDRGRLVGIEGRTGNGPGSTVEKSDWEGRNQIRKEGNR
jgi:hypothetical protein